MIRRSATGSSPLSRGSSVLTLRPMRSAQEMKLDNTFVSNSDFSLQGREDLRLDAYSMSQFRPGKSPMRTQYGRASKGQHLTRGSPNNRTDRG